jgi:hypothetical protein
MISFLIYVYLILSLYDRQLIIFLLSLPLIGLNNLREIQGKDQNRSWNRTRFSQIQIVVRIGRTINVYRLRYREKREGEIRE